MAGYLKCVVANKATLAGYVGMIAGLAGYFFGTDVVGQDNRGVVEFCSFYAGFGGLLTNMMTAFGMETFDAYRRTLRHIDKTGTLDERFYELYGSVYCTSKGAQLAAREAGLEHLISRPESIETTT
jgi:hypothetical protein